MQEVCPFQNDWEFRVNILFSVSNLPLLFQHSNSLLPPRILKCGSSFGGACDTHKLNDRVDIISDECVLGSLINGGWGGGGGEWGITTMSHCH